MINLCPEILIISNKHDYSSDYITYNLNKIGVSYLRLNRDQLSDFKISLFPAEQRFIGEGEDFSFEITLPTLKSIYFRGPIFLRDIYQPNILPEDQLSRSQWASFIRNLIIFDDILWVNHPQKTYKAEMKAYQLLTAKRIGFKIPNTIIANTIKQAEDIITNNDQIIIKTLEPAILRIDSQEAFIYTNFLSLNGLSEIDISSAPVLLQEALIPKVDIRVTVVGKKIYSVSILKDGEGINNDWRLEKNNVQYHKISLPQPLEKLCITMVIELGLKFGAIDLVLHNNDYYFLEINPTGEWAFLIESTRYNIDLEIVNLLLRGDK